MGIYTLSELTAAPSRSHGWRHQTFKMAKGVKLKVLKLLSYNISTLKTTQGSFSPSAAKIHIKHKLA